MAKALARPIGSIVLTIIVVSCVWCAPAPEPWTVGRVEGASFRLKVPQRWNGSLVLAAGGYSPDPVIFTAQQNAGRFAEDIVRQGFAYAETGYSVGGVAIREGVSDVRALQRYFSREYGTPERTFLVGESKGGLITVLLTELADSEIDGALTVSGLLAGPHELFGDAFHTLRSFQQIFPAVLPPPERIPATFRADEQTVGRVLTTLRQDDRQSTTLRSLARVNNNQELAELLTFHTEALGDLQRRCGGNGFGEQPDERARRCVEELPTPSGVLRRPVLALDARHDPVIPAMFAEQYGRKVLEAGSTHLFVHRVVDVDGHLAIRTAERARAFAELVRWVVDGVRPGGVGE